LIHKTARSRNATGGFVLVERGLSQPAALSETEGRPNFQIAADFHALRIETIRAPHAWLEKSRLTKNFAQRNVGNMKLNLPTKGAVA